VTEMYLKDEGWEGMDWIDLAQDRDRKLAVFDLARTFGLHKIRGILDKLELLLPCQR